MDSDSHFLLCPRSAPWGWNPRISKTRPRDCDHRRAEVPGGTERVPDAAVGGATALPRIGELRGVFGFRSFLVAAMNESSKLAMHFSVVCPDLVSVGIPEHLPATGPDFPGNGQSFGVGDGAITRFLEEFP